MRVRGGISSSNRTDVKGRDSSEAAHHGGGATGRRTTMVRTALRPRAQPDESRAHAGESSLTHSLSNSGLFDLSGRVAIVTGTSRGLGQVFARAIANAGADLILTSRNRESLSTFESEIKSLGRRAISLELDVRDHQSIERMAATAEREFGHFDILVNNAGCNIR